MTRLLALFVTLLVPCEALVVGARALAPASSAVVRSPLRNVRAEEPMPPPPSSRLGATVDQDGKSNVWVSVCCARAQWGCFAH